MYLKRILLRNFRNYAQTQILFSPSINFIQGKNGQGKTNLLEAIYLISTGRSFRTHNLCDLIAFGQKFFYLEAEFEKSGVSQTISIYYDNNGRKVQHDGATYSTLHSLLGVIPSILLAPDDISLITGSPSERRRFLDLHIAQTDPSYLFHLGRYFKAMKQRNHLLRSPSLSTITAWEQMMAQSANEIILKRKQAIIDLSATLKKWVEILSEALDEVQIHYHTSPAALIDETNIVDYLQKGFEKMRPKEKEIGNTLIGPHRDDLSIQLSHKSAKSFSSEGQKRGCISALRFAQWEQMSSLLDHKPLLGIDDFGIQLDAGRQFQLKHYLSSFKQVFLTSPSFVQEDLSVNSYKVLQIEKGNIIER
jgi:DNA replication and repair protein RecF